MQTQQRFVVDNTNPTKEDRKRYIEMARDAGYKVVGYYFQSQVHAAMERNDSRLESEQIPQKGIFSTHSKLELPSYSEGFDELHYVSIGDDGDFRVEGWKDEV